MRCALVAVVFASLSLLQAAVVTAGPAHDRDAVAGYTGWSAIGENIAAGYPTPEAVVAGWMSSPGHRANILSPNFTEIGIGLAQGGKYGSYWTQDFGTRPSV